MLTEINLVMRLLVLVKVATLAEVLTADFTLEWFLICMRASVAAQLCCLPERTATTRKVAFERPVAGVYIYMVIQSLLRRKGSTAVDVGAGVRSICLVG